MLRKADTDPDQDDVTDTSIRPVPRPTSSPSAGEPPHSNPTQGPSASELVDDERRAPFRRTGHPLTALLGIAQEFLPDISTTMTLGNPSAPTRTLTRDTHGQALEGAQWSAGEGPTFTAETTQLPTMSPDLANDARWPSLGSTLVANPAFCWPRSKSPAPAAGTPTISVLAVPIRIDEDVAGVLCGYSDQPHAFADDEVLTRATLLASAAGLILQAHQQLVQAQDEATQLRTAMNTRACIEQAKGIVSAHLDVPVEDAFGVLSRASQNHNTKINRLAAVLVDRPADPGMLGMLHATAQRYGLYS